MVESLVIIDKSRDSGLVALAGKSDRHVEFAENDFLGAGVWTPLTWNWIFRNADVPNERVSLVIVTALLVQVVFNGKVVADRRNSILKSCLGGCVESSVWNFFGFVIS